MIWTVVVLLAVGVVTAIAVVLVSLVYSRRGDSRSKAALLQRSAGPLRAELRQDGSPQVDIQADFPKDLVRVAWRRQGHRCASCGRPLIWRYRNRESAIGAWETHHRIPKNHGGMNDLKNCVILCSGVGNCHFNIGHGGIDQNHYSVLDNDSLPYRTFGWEKTRMARSRRGFLTALLGRLSGA